MRNKILLLIPIVLLVFVLVGCNLITPPGLVEPEEPIEVLSADVIVIEWEQLFVDPEAEVLEYEDEISIDYLITNTGTLDIDFSKILFEVIYKDIKKDVYLVWTNGIGVDIDCYESGYIADVWAGNREVIDVVAIDWELASYEL